MEGSCPNTSAYDPSSLVEAFHSIPHVDIDLNTSPDEFELSINYFQAIIIWACVPILVAICLFILMAVYWICLCCCCCCQDHGKRSKKSKGCCGLFIIILVLISLAMVGVGIWAEFELDRNILESVSSARNATDITEDIRNTTLSFMYNEAGTEATLESLEQGLQNEGAEADNATNSAVVLRVLNQGLGTVFREIQAQAIPIDFGDLSPAFNALDTFELARHWSVVGYLIATGLLILLVGISVCLSACCHSLVCMIITLIVFFVPTLVMWVAVGGNLALLVVSGDVCSGPDGLIRNFTSTLPNTMVSEELLDYYLICNATCYSSPFQPFFDNATATFATINDNEVIIRSYLSDNPNGPLQDDLSSVTQDFNIASSFVTSVEELTNCEILNSAYLSVLSDLCTNGYMFSVVLFSMACGLAVMMMLLLIFGSLYAGLFAKGSEYDDETVVYGFDNEPNGPSPWDSYGTQQTYTAYRGEAFDMRTSPQGLTSDPPKYADLSQRYGDAATNGSQFNSDGTVGVSIRPASRDDIDIGEALDP